MRRNLNTRLWMVLLTLLAVGGMTGCSRAPKQTAEKPTTLLQGNGEELNPYVQGVVALSRDDFEKAKVAFADFAPALQKKGTPEAAKLATVARTIAASKDIREMRAALKPLSKSVSTYVEGAGVKGLTAYFCPHKNGYWLSTSLEVENPYAGAEMFSCGSPVNRVQ